MCGEPTGVVDALALLDHALDALNAADAGSLPASVQAEALRELERAEPKHTAARASLLAAFASRGGHEGDGQGSARTWLRWQTRVTRGAAAGAVGWARRLAGHPLIAEALAAGQISSSWARQICCWSDLLPADCRDDADAILAAAARGGANETDLASLAREMHERASRAAAPRRAVTPVTGMEGRTPRTMTGDCGWASPSAARDASTATSPPGAPPRCPRCWTA